MTAVITTAALALAVVIELAAVGQSVRDKSTVVRCTDLAEKLEIPDRP